MRLRGRWVVSALLLALGGLAAWQYGPALIADRASEPGLERPERLVPDSLRITVEVLNASSVRGLARRATFYLRDRGFDVVNNGNASERLDSTVVLVRSGRMDWGELAAAALGGARVEARPDSSRYLDLTILLGATWRPPAEAFHP